MGADGQVVILAGGLGTRLWPVTQQVPKPMVPVAGMPYLHHQIVLLEKQSLTDIVMLTGYLGEQIEEYFGDGSGWGVRIRYHREQAPLGTGGALRDARELLAERFLLIYGDSYLPIDYRPVYSALHDGSALGAVVVYDNRLDDTSVQSNTAVDEDDRVVRYEKESADPSSLGYVDAGVLAFDRKVIEMLAPDGVVSLERSLFPQLIAERKLRAVRTSQRFYDIGTPDRLKAIEAMLSGAPRARAV